MSATYVAKITDYTKSISVDGKNTIEVGLTYENKGSGYYMCELLINLGTKHLVKYIDGDTNSSYYTNKVTFTIPVEWLAEIPSSPLGTGTIIVRTVDMNASDLESAVYFEDVRNFTVYVPEEFKPEISNLSVQMYDSIASVDYAVYGMTYPHITAKVTPHLSSPIKRYRITGGGIEVSGDYEETHSSNYNFSNYCDMKTVSALSNTKFTLTVWDARGRTASISSEDIYIQAYTRPSIKSLSAYRTDKDGLTQADGDFIKVTVEAGISPIKDSSGAEANTLKCYIGYKQSNDSGNYYVDKEITNGEPYIFEADKDTNFEIKCEVRDKYLNTIAYRNVLGDSKDLNFCDGGGGAAIGTKATKDYFDVAYNSRFQKGISANEEISSSKGIVSRGNNSRGDFLTFGSASRIIAYETPGGFYYGDDFDDYTTIGVYGIYYSGDINANGQGGISNGGYIRNMPCNEPGTLRVYNATGNTGSTATEQYLMQEYVVYDGSAVYRRCLSKVRDSSDVAWPIYWTYGPWQCYAGVEKGTSGIWTYKKWGDGEAECYGRFIYQNLTLAASGAATTINIGISFPFAFATYPNITATLSDELNYHHYILQLYASNTGISNVQVASIHENVGEIGGVSGVVNFMVNGRWK